MRRNSIILSDDGRKVTTATRRDSGGVILNQATSFVMLSADEWDALLQFVGTTPQLGKLQRVPVAGSTGTAPPVARVGQLDDAENRAAPLVS